MSRESQHTHFEDEIQEQVRLWGFPPTCASLLLVSKYFYFKLICHGLNTGWFDYGSNPDGTVSRPLSIATCPECFKQICIKINANTIQYSNKYIYNSYGSNPHGTVIPPFVICYLSLTEGLMLQTTNYIASTLFTSNLIWFQYFLEKVLIIALWYIE